MDQYGKGLLLVAALLGAVLLSTGVAAQPNGGTGAEGAPGSQWTIVRIEE